MACHHIQQPSASNRNKKKLGGCAPDVALNTSKLPLQLLNHSLVLFVLRQGDLEASAYCKWGGSDQRKTATYSEELHIVQAVM
eukprot:35847-Eustigmatos_ZCMA.PRE.1